jgi:hypothetical protein
MPPALSNSVPTPRPEPKSSGIYIRKNTYKCPSTYSSGIYRPERPKKISAAYAISNYTLHSKREGDPKRSVPTYATSDYAPQPANML